MPPRVILDANVFFPFTLRDTLLRAVSDGYFQLYWSEQILEEARRNLKDFRDLPKGIEARSPDDFLLELFAFDAEGMVALLHEQAAALRKPPLSFEELLGGLKKIVPGFAAAVGEYLASG